MNMTKRRIAIAAGAVVLVAGVVAGRERPSIELVSERTPPPAAAAASAAVADLDLTRLDRGEASLPQVDPFSQKHFGKAENRAIPSAKPEAPPLPFQYFGRITENGKTDVFVMQAGDLIAISPGQKLGDYRVDKIGANSIAFTYLPLKAKQTLEIQ